MYRLILSILFVLSCGHIKHNQSPKNVILLIGDGMGPQQISLLYYFTKYSQLKVLDKTDFAFEKIPNVSLSATEPYGNLVADSASSATQLAIGAYSRSEMIGVDHLGEVQDTILEKAKAKGMSVGLVSDTRLTHATPGAFASHVTHRSFENEMAKQMISQNVDIMLSGGINRFIPSNSNFQLRGKNIKSKRTDQLDLLKQAEKNGYQVVHEKSSLENLNHQQKILGLFTEDAMPDGIWYSKNNSKKDREIPNLLEMTQTAVKRLAENPKGYFLMVEGGQIDWAGHANDAGTMLHQMIHFNQTLLWIIDHVKKNSNTLLVVTADHETGSFGLAYNIHSRPKGITISSSNFNKFQFRPNYNFGTHQILDQLYQQKTSFNNMWSEYKKLPEKEKNAKNFQSIINQNSQFKVSLDQTRRILQEQTNPYIRPDHKYLKNKKWPAIKDFRSFYYSPRVARNGLIGRALADQQNVVWGTGSHTATPVLVFSLGPKDTLDQIKGYQTHPQLGQIMQEYLNL